MVCVDDWTATEEVSKKKEKGAYKQKISWCKEHGNMVHAATLPCPS